MGGKGLKEVIVTKLTKRRYGGGEDENRRQKWRRRKKRRVISSRDSKGGRGRIGESKRESRWCSN